MRLLGLLPARPRNFPCSGVSLGDVPDFLGLDHSWRFGVTNKNHRWNQIWVLSNKHWDLTQMIPEMSSKCRSDPAEHVDVDQSNRNFWKKSPISALLVYIYLHYRLDFSIIYIYIRIYIHYIIIIWGEIHWYLPMISRHWHSPAEPTNWCSRSSGTWRFAVFAAKDGGVQGQKLVTCFDMISCAFYYDFIWFLYGFLGF